MLQPGPIVNLATVLMHPNLQVENEETTRHKVPGQKALLDGNPTALFIFYSTDFHGDYLFLSRPIIFSAPRAFLLLRKLRPVTRDPNARARSGVTRRARRPRAPLIACRCA
ncbi:hypothetical protein [Paraburkholderia caballeronis]|uniref:hypothetical protein n=1 Tax=Paraburkholderia caballeronis TaxID=416943 RepID=UPI00116008B4|nr:hypothetical protein [Paraburkholderia caballeronis]